MIWSPFTNPWAVGADFLFSGEVIVSPRPVLFGSGVAVAPLPGRLLISVETCLDSEQLSQASSGNLAVSHTRTPPLTKMAFMVDYVTMGYHNPPIILTSSMGIYQTFGSSPPHFSQD